MTEEFGTLISLPLSAGTTFCRPRSLPELVHLDSPALDVMTDLKHTGAVTISPHALIDVALEKMKYVGVRLLLVVGDHDEVIGLITANDIQGEMPVQTAEVDHIEHNKISVDMIMTPQSEITVMDMISIRNAKVSHIIDTLHKLERHHGLVVQTDADNKQTIRGIFSFSQISRQLVEEIGDDIAGAHSLAELVQGTS